MPILSNKNKKLLKNVKGEYYESDVDAGFIQKDHL